MSLRSGTSAAGWANQNERTFVIFHIGADGTPGPDGVLVGGTGATGTAPSPRSRSRCRRRRRIAVAAGRGGCRRGAPRAGIRRGRRQRHRAAALSAARAAHSGIATGRRDRR